MNNIRSLRSLSFKIICENFSSYVLKCQTTQDDNFKKNMCFLQLKYSKVLLYKLDKKEMLEEFHLDFLLNDHLQEVDIALLLSYSNKDKIIEKLIPISHNFVEITCSNNCDKEACLDTLLAVIPHAVNAEKIKIPSICKDELLKVIARSCPQLTELDIHSSSVTDEGLKVLCLDPENSTKDPCKLKYLDISYLVVSLENVMILLKDIPTLEELIYEELQTALHSIYKEDIDNNVSPSSRKYNIRTLDFTLYDEVSLLTLLNVCDGLCPFVKKLVIYISEQKVLDTLCNLFSELESITFKSSLFFFNDTEIDLDNFILLKGQRLKNLSVTDFTLSIPVLIENCPKLESLRLTNTDHELISKKPTSFLTNLNELKIETFISDPIIDLLNASPNVKTLLLSGVDRQDFTDSALIGNLSKFAFNTSLTYLIIVNSDLEVYLVEQVILNCKSLKTLLLHGCKNIRSDEVDRLEEFVKTSNRKIEIICNNDAQSNSDDIIDQIDDEEYEYRYGYINSVSDDDDHEHYGYQNTDSEDSDDVVDVDYALNHYY